METFLQNVLNVSICNDGANYVLGRQTLLALRRLPITCGFPPLLDIAEGLAVAKHFQAAKKNTSNFSGINIIQVKKSAKDAIK
jgi:hypothetical protein